MFSLYTANNGALIGAAVASVMTITFVIMVVIMVVVTIFFIKSHFRKSRLSNSLYVIVLYVLRWSSFAVSIETRYWNNELNENRFVLCYC